MVETNATKANDQITAAQEELRTLAMQLQQFLDLHDCQAWEPESVTNTRAAESESRLRKIDRIRSRKFGIVGMEGVGKSTLINAIFGRSVVPADADQPGTAIPTLVYASSGGSTAFAIETEEGEIRPCANYEELTSYVLQRHNADNFKQIRQATISQPCPHLPPGLCLVDLPGSAGMSSSFRESAIASLESVDRVILVVQDRNAGPALELAHNLISRGIEICGVAINLQMSKLIDPGNLRPLPDDEARNHIATTRDHIQRNFLAELPQLRETCGFFAFHFPSMQSLSIDPNVTHWIPAHIEEIFRFSDWFIASSGNAATIARLLEATKDFAVQLTQTKERFLTQREQFDGLLKSDPAVQEHVCQALAKRQKTLWQEWARNVSDGPIKEAKLKAWSGFAPNATQLKTDLQQLQQTIRDALPDDWWSQNWRLKSEISERLNHHLSSAGDRLNIYALKVLQEFSDSVQQVAAEFTAAELSIAPIDLGPLPISPPKSISVWAPPLIDPERQSFAEYDSAKIIERILDELAVAELSLTFVQGDQIHEAFHAMLSGIVSDAENELERRQNDLIKVVRGGPSPALEQSQQSLNNRLAKLEEFEISFTSLHDRISAFELNEEEHLSHIRATREEIRERYESGIRRSLLDSGSILGAKLARPQITREAEQVSIRHRFFQRLFKLLGNRKR